MGSIKFKPYGDRVLVETITEDSVSQSGIVLSTENNEKPVKGTVQAISDTVSFQEQDVVYFRKYAGSEIKLEGKDYLVLNTEDILGILYG